MARTKDIDADAPRRIKEWREATKRTRLGLSKELGVAKTSVSNWELGQNEPNRDVYAKLALLADGDNRWWFLSKAGIERSDLRNLALSDTPSKTLAKKPAQPFISIPLIIGDLGAGPGRIHGREESEGDLLLPREICPNPAHTVCIRVHGDSMDPTIPDGSLIAVDRGQRERRGLEGKIVVARRDDEGSVVKRLMSRNGKLFLVSDNPFHAAMEWGDDWGIVGRVVWWVARAE